MTVDEILAVDREIAPGVYPDMTEHGWERDEWPAIFERVMAADILVLLTPIWLGEKSSVCTRVTERLYGNSTDLNEAGQFAYYGRRWVGAWSRATRTATPGASPPTATSPRRGMRAARGTSRTPSTAEVGPLRRRVRGMRARGVNRPGVRRVIRVCGPTPILRPPAGLRGCGRRSR